jgi:hypothetical protein
MKLARIAVLILVGALFAMIGHQVHANLGEKFEATTNVTPVVQHLNEIPNGDFEEWNDFSLVNYGAFQPPNKVFQTVFKSTEAPSGRSSVKIVNVALHGQVIPGGIWYSKGDYRTPPRGREGFSRAKFPITKRHKTLCGYYKAKLLGDDKLWISVGIFNGENNVIGGTDSGGIQHAFITENTSAWKPFQVPISYDPTRESLPADFAALEIAIAGKRFPQSPNAFNGTAGSEVHVDALSFCKGKEDILVPKPKPSSQ